MDVVEVSCHRLVHLDLKGAPPKVGYYEKLIPYLKSLGVTGLLMEYEDMFPYSGDLADIACSNTYSLEDIRWIQELVKFHQMMIVPLVQTFGHMEFVLKHRRFQSLREVDIYPNSLCPSLPDSLQMIFEMVSQIIQAHADSRWIHIGADEVWHLGICHRCKNRMAEHGWTAEQLYLRHIIDVAQYIRSRFPNVAVIVWDDMFRLIPGAVLFDSGIGTLIEPMVWSYQSMDLGLPERMWEEFAVAFRHIWIASAFKGATGAKQLIPDVGHHIKNHELWLNTLPIIKKKFDVGFRGWALTGWQRYDHYAVLCELLPVGMLSLELCLRTIYNDKSMNIRNESSECLLSVDEQKALTGFLSPQQEYQNLGSSVFNHVKILNDFIARHQALITNYVFKGWFSEFHVKYSITNPLHIGPLLQESKILGEQLSILKAELQLELQDVYYQRTVEEWMMQYVDPVINDLSEIFAKMTTLLNVANNST